jgi:hypothetical protein
MNYAVALIGLLIIGVVWQIKKRAEKPLLLIAPTKPDTTSTDSSKGDA